LEQFGANLGTNTYEINTHFVMKIGKIVQCCRYRKMVFIFSLIFYVTEYFSKITVSFNILVQVSFKSDVFAANLEDYSIFLKKHFSGK